MPTTRGTILWIYSLFLILVLPVALFCHLHLYGDGAPFLSILLQTGEPRGIAGTLSRAAHHYLTQTPVLWVKTAGVQDVRLLSWVYGSLLYLAPWACYAASTLLFLRSRQLLPAALVTLAFCLSCCWSWVFIISESHLGAGLFFLAVAVAETRFPGPRTYPWVLLGLVVLGCFVYEFWVIYCGIILALMIFRERAKPGVEPSRPAAGIVQLACLAGILWLAYAIVTSPLGANRDAMLRSHLWSVFGEIIFANLAFTVIAFLGFFTESCGRRVGATGG
jgi:hypothetical protein